MSGELSLSVFTVEVDRVPVYSIQAKWQSHAENAEMLARLAPYKCVRVTQYPSGLELWETGWSEPFTLWVENGGYSELQYFRLIGGLIAQTMPAGWNGTP